MPKPLKGSGGVGAAPAKPSRQSNPLCEVNPQSGVAPDGGTNRFDRSPHQVLRPVVELGAFDRQGVLVIGHDLEQVKERDGLEEGEEGVPP